MHLIAVDRCQIEVIDVNIDQGDLRQHIGDHIFIFQNHSYSGDRDDRDGNDDAEPFVLLELRVRENHQQDQIKDIDSKREEMQISRDKIVLLAVTKDSERRTQAPRRS